jgi:hypothetical protein
MNRFVQHMWVNVKKLCRFNSEMPQKLFVHLQIIPVEAREFHTKSPKQSYLDGVTQQKLDEFFSSRKGWRMGGFSVSS